MRIAIALLALPLVACQSPGGPEKELVYPIPMAEPPPPYPELAWLIGMNADEVIERLGAPAVRKPRLLDYQSSSCDFSILLRPDRNGDQRVNTYFALTKNADVIELQPCWSSIFGQRSPAQP